MAIAALLGISCAWMPFKYWRLEIQLAEKASELADGYSVTLHCNSLFDSIFDNELSVAGHANRRTGEIVFQFGWCKNMLSYLMRPEKIDRDELYSLNLFTHEAMHIRGETDEQKTECQALQRNYRAARLLGVPERLARRHATAIYQEIYPSHPYFSLKCGPGKEWDEGLPDPPW